MSKTIPFKSLSVMISDLACLLISCCKRIRFMTIRFTGPDSSSGRASASGSGGRRFDPRPRHTKGVKNGTGSSLADARNKRVVPGRYKKAGKYLLRIFVMSHNSS